MYCGFNSAEDWLDAVSAIIDTPQQREPYNNKIVAWFKTKWRENYKEDCPSGLIINLLEALNYMKVVELMFYKPKMEKIEKVMIEFLNIKLAIKISKNSKTMARVVKNRHTSEWYSFQRLVCKMSGGEETSYGAPRYNLFQRFHTDESKIEKAILEDITLIA